MDVQSLADELPDGAVTTDPDVLRAASRDWWPLAWLHEVRGDPPALPGAVVRPGNVADIQTTIRWASAHRVAVVPRGGGSGVSGGAVTGGGELVLDLGGLADLVELDAESLTAVVQAGARGDALEARLRAQGLTIGHYPQSMAISTVGGWISAAGAGHASAGYGTIEDRLLGLEAVLPDGELLRLRAVPRSAAGPDLRRWFVGAEGAFGVVTEATLAVDRAPAGYRWCSYRLPGFPAAIALCRQLAQAGLPALVVRAYDEQDTALTFAAAGVDSGCVVIAAFDADLPVLGWAVDACDQIAAEHGGRRVDDPLGEHWHVHHRDGVETLRSIMGPDRAWGSGVLVDTIEVAALWRAVGPLHRAVLEAIGATAVGAACHLSHLYRSGASLYFTFLLRAEDDALLDEPYGQVWADAVAACHRAGGTMTHHHGVGRLRAGHLEEELGAGGLRMLRRAKDALDPGGVLNPGALLPRAGRDPAGG